jgi:hypothetical protein
MVKPMHPNEAFSKDSFAERDGAFKPAAEVFEAHKIASQTVFPNTDIMLEDLTGQKALERLLGQSDELSRRVSAANSLYQGINTTGLYAIIAKLTPSAILKTVDYIRRDTILPALKTLRDSDGRLKDVSDELLDGMAADIQLTVARSVQIPKQATEQTAGMRLARFGGSNSPADETPRLR